MDLKHWKLEVDAQNLAWLWFDRADTATNTFSTEALEELGRVADHLATMPPKGLAILSAKDSQAAFLRGLGSKDLTISGDFRDVMWFQGLTAFLQPPKVISPYDRTAF